MFAIPELRIPSSGTYVITQDIAWVNPITNKFFYCPQYFVTDYASTNIIKFSEAGELAALFHDVDYWLQEKTRAEADIDFLDNLKALGVGKFKATAYYTAVFAFGWTAWRTNKKQKTKYGLNYKILDVQQFKKIMNK
jgi:hypothetical protein